MISPDAVSIKTIGYLRGLPTGTPSTAQGTVTLAGPAAPSSTVVNLSCSNPRVTLPASINFPAGSTTLTFPINIPCDTPPGPATITALSSGPGGIPKQAILAINYLVQLSKVATNATLASDPSCDLCRGPIGQLADQQVARPGYICGGMVSLDAMAPAGGIKVNLKSSLGFVEIDPSVLVPAGANSGRFRMKVAASMQPGPVTITAAMEGSSAPPVQSILTIQPFQNFSLSLNPMEVDPGAASTGTVQLEAPSPKTVPVAVALSSSSPAITVPASIAIPGGQAMANFTISVKPTAPIGSSATIYGTMGSYSARQAPVLKVSAVKVGLGIPARLLVATQVQGTAYLSGIAGTLTTINLSSSSPDVTVPPTVTIAVGQDKTTFTITTRQTAAVGSAVTLAAVRADTGGTPAQATSTVLGVAPVVSITAPALVIGGQTYTGTVTLMRQAESGGAVVNLRTADGVLAPVTIPSNVTVPAGQTSAVFTISVAGKGLSGTDIKHGRFRIGSVRSGQDPKYELFSEWIQTSWSSN